jgi:hypothetical protein
MEQSEWSVEPFDQQNETIRLDLLQPEDVSSVFRISSFLRITNPDAQEV